MTNQEVKFEGPGPVPQMPPNWERRTGYLVVQFEGPGHPAEVTHITQLPIRAEQDQSIDDDTSQTVGQAAINSLVEVDDTIFIRSIN